MSVTKSSVLLLKAQIGDDKQQDKYEVMLKENGFLVMQVRTLDFKYKNLEILKNKLNNSSDYAGLVLSSPRCVLAVKYALKLVDHWKLKENYVVGEATYEIAFSELGIQCKGKESGNAENLSKILLKDDKSKKIFLYPHGNLKMDILKTKLSNSEITLDEVEVYETITNENIDRDFDKATNSCSIIPEYMVFFSPSGIKAFNKILSKLPLDSIKLIAIGPTTEVAMIESGLKVFGVAENPTPQDILKLLLVPNVF